VSSPITPEAFVDDLIELFERRGARRYGEDVTQLDHALQSAHHALADDAGPELVAAALLHDIGHLLDKRGEDAADRGLDTRHEVIGAGYLTRGFGPGVTEPVRLHVVAKRYLATAEPGYADQLSRASMKSLMLQGGPMDEAEAARFTEEPACEAAVRLRRYDEMGKVQGAAPAPLESYRELLLELARASFDS
jgi:phosphonate degradation associated HDIG domain protein